MNAASVARALPDNPLPPCPSSPNCVRETRLFAAPPATLFRQAYAALQTLGAARVEADPAAYRLDAVFTVFIFKDDVAVAVTPFERGAALHIRSASRVGRRDFGVNRRRVDRFFDVLQTPPY